MEQEQMARIYKLIDPLPSSMIYIGRTVQPLEVRRRQHLRNADWSLCRAPVCEWIRLLRQNKREPVIIELELAPYSQAPAAEDRWIAAERAGGSIVLNQRNGATGGPSRPIHQQPIHHGPNQPYRGVSQQGKKWMAIMQHKGIRQNLGRYATAEEAARAYDQAAIALFGDKALLNFPPERQD